MDSNASYAGEVERNVCRTTIFRCAASFIKSTSSFSAGPTAPGDPRRCRVAGGLQRRVLKDFPQPRPKRRLSIPRCALLLAYYDPDGRLVYTGRVGTGIGQAELERLWRRLQPLATSEMPLQVAPPRTNRFGSPLVLAACTEFGPSLWSRSNPCMDRGKPASSGRLRGPARGQGSGDRPAPPAPPIVRGRPVTVGA